MNRREFYQPLEERNLVKWAGSNLILAGILCLITALLAAVYKKIFILFSLLGFIAYVVILSISTTAGYRGIKPYKVSKK